MPDGILGRDRGEQGFDDRPLGIGKISFITKGLHDPPFASEQGFTSLSAESSYELSCFQTGSQFLRSGTAKDLPIALVFFAPFDPDPVSGHMD